MIIDHDCNFVYFSELLEVKCPNIFKQLTHQFNQLQIKFDTLPNTKDLWVVDFMPIQVSQDYFLQFKYDPDYLKSPKEQHTKTDPTFVCNEIGIVPSIVDIVLDGGNVVKCQSKVILTTKVFKENLSYAEGDLIAEIQKQLHVEQVIIIPLEPDDPIGHSDGMVRFIDEDTVLVNQYPKNKTYENFAYSLRWSLRNAGLRVMDLPYDSWENKDKYDATGCYINFLEIGKYIFYPIYSVPSDQLALLRLKEAFDNERVFVDIDCRELAKFGGVLNCATWNVLK